MQNEERLAQLEKRQHPDMGSVITQLCKGYLGYYLYLATTAGLAADSSGTVKGTIGPLERTLRSPDHDDGSMLAGDYQRCPQAQFAREDMQQPAAAPDTQKVKGPAVVMEPAVAQQAADAGF